MAFFSDLLKKWFYTNNSSAASSDARIPLLTATGEPKGSDTMANLASVLGEITPILSVTDFNELTTTIISSWVQGTDIANAPYSGGILGFLIVNKGYLYEIDGSSNISQIFHGMNGKVYVRNRTNYIWSNWEEISTNIPSFYKSYNNINQLSEGVGIRHFTIERAANAAIDETITLGVTSPLFTIALNGSGPSGVFFSPYWHSDVTTITKSEDFYTFTRNGTTLRVQAPAQTYSVEIKISVFS